jgi:hypothetical protein
VYTSFPNKQIEEDNILGDLVSNNAEKTKLYIITYIIK